MQEITKLVLKRVLTDTLFLCKMQGYDIKFMDKEKLKLIVRNLKSLVDALESEVYSDVQAYTYERNTTLAGDYDEVFEDDDGYPD